jgi:predicted nucleic acid-binding protein
MRKQRLSSADLCHLSIARETGLAIVTNDKHFHSLSNSPVEIVNY